MSDEKLPALGLRERNKIEKLRRIKLAARELFISRGFDDTTTREVAQKADVGLGTLFAYAADKRDLLYLSVNDDLEAIIGKSIDLIDDDADVVDNIVTVFRTHYDFFSHQPELARLVMRELQFYDSGTQAERLRATRNHAQDIIVQIIKLGQSRGALDADVDSKFAAEIAFSILRWQLRYWLTSPKPDVSMGMRRLRRAMELFLTGISAKTSGTDKTSLP